MATKMDEDVNIRPWGLYGKEFEVPESKMGKSETEKGYPLRTSSGEGSRVTASGATVHLDRPKPKEKDKKEPKLWLSPGPTTKKSTVDPDMDKERSMGKSVELLDELAKSVTPGDPTQEGIDLLKGCGGAEGTKKADLGTLVIPDKKTPGQMARFSGEGTRPSGSPVLSGLGEPGLEKPGLGDLHARAKIKEATQKKGEPPISLVNKKEGVKKSEENVDKATPIHLPTSPVSKALTARAMPRMPRAMQQEMIRRNAQSVMTRGNSRFAKDIHTGPLDGETIKTVEEDEHIRTGRQEVYKSCDGCGRRYKLFKGMDDGCPTCNINKSTHCDACGRQLVKSHGGSIRCPICG
jgi:hypothetical protein